MDVVKSRGRGGGEKRLLSFIPCYGSSGSEICKFFKRRDHVRAGYVSHVTTRWWYGSRIKGWMKGGRDRVGEN